MKKDQIFPLQWPDKKTNKLKQQINLTVHSIECWNPFNFPSQTFSTEQQSLLWVSHPRCKLLKWDIIASPPFYKQGSWGTDSIQRGTAKSGLNPASNPTQRLSPSAHLAGGPALPITWSIKASRSPEPNCGPCHSNARTCSLCSFPWPGWARGPTEPATGEPHSQSNGLHKILLVILNTRSK